MKIVLRAKCCIVRPGRAKMDLIIILPSSESNPFATLGSIGEVNGALYHKCLYYLLHISNDWECCLLFPLEG